jgi:hypothetical protein
LIAEHAAWAIKQIGARQGINPWDQRTGSTKEVAIS